MPIYYIDNNRGSAGNDGLSPGAAKKDLSFITGFASAQPGDAFLLADDSRWDLVMDTGRVLPPTSWTGAPASPVIIGKYSPSSQSIGQRPLIVYNYTTQRSDWVEVRGSPNLNGWAFLHPSNHVNRAYLVRINDSWLANATDQATGEAVASVDGRFNLLTQAQTLTVFGVNQAARAIVLYSPPGVNPVDYYGKIVVSPQAQGAIALSSGRRSITVQDIAFQETGVGVLMFSLDANPADFVVQRCRMDRGCLSVANGESTGALRAVVRNNEVYDFGAIGIHTLQTSGNGVAYSEISNNKIVGGVNIWAQGGIYIQTRLGSTGQTNCLVYGNDVSGCKWGTSGKSTDGSGIYLETGAGGVKVFNNVIHDSYCGIQDNSGRVNYVIGNLVYNVRLGVRVSDQNNNNAGHLHLYNNTFIVGDLKQTPTQFGGAQGQEYPGVWMFDPNTTLDLTARNNIFANVGEQFGRATFGVADNHASSALTLANNWTFGFGANALRASDNSAVATSVTPAGTTDPRPFLDAGYTLKVPSGTDMSSLAAANPLALSGTYIQGVTLRNGRMRPGFCPVGAYQAELPRAARA